MPNPFGDEPVNQESVNPFGDAPAEQVITDPSIVSQPVENERSVNLPRFSSQEIMQGFQDGKLSENAMNAGLELQKRGKLGEGTIPYLESLKTSRLAKDIGALDKPASEPGIDLWEMATGEKRKTELTETLPEFRETEPVQEPSFSGKSLGLSAGLMFSLTDQDAMDVIKEAIPEAEFIKDEKGNVIVEVDGKLSVLNKPGFSKQDSVKAVTQFLSFLPASKAALFGKSILAKFGIGAAASGATEATIQEIEQATGVTKERDAGRVALATGIGGAAELIGPAYKAQKEFRQGRALKQAGEGITDVPETIATAKEAVEGIKEFTGVDVPLYKPQQTLTPSDVKLMRFMPQLDATSQKAAASLTKQSKKVEEAVDKAVENFIPGEVMNAPEELRTAAGRAIKAKKLIRRELSSPFFEEAKKEVVDVSDVTKLIDDKMKPYKGESNIKTQLGKIKGNVAGEVEVIKEREIFHGTDKIFEEFDVKKTPDGSIWFTDKKETILKGESGASGTSRIINKFIDENDLKLAGWDEYDKYSLDQLQEMGFDGVKLLDEGETTYQIFTPEKLKAEPTKIIKSEGESTMEELMNAKATIDDILAVKTGDSVVKGKAKAVITEVKEKLMEAMDGAGAKTPEEAKALRSKVKEQMDRVQKGEVVTPEEIAELPAYGQGRIKFAQASPDVVALEKGLTGKLAKADDLQVEQIANQIFNPRLRAQTIKNAKIVLDDVDPDIFPQILKFKMLDNLGKMKPAKAGAIENVAGKTRSALFGNEPQKRALMAGMTTDQKRNFNYLDTMLDRASRGRAEGSPTASFQELMKNIKSVPMFFQKLLTVNVGEVKNIGKQGMLDRRLKSLAEMVYDDSWASELSRIRAMDPNTAAAGKAMLQLMDNIGVKEE